MAIYEAKIWFRSDKLTYTCTRGKLKFHLFQDMVFNWQHGPNPQWKILKLSTGQKKLPKRTITYEYKGEACRPGTGEAVSPTCGEAGTPIRGEAIPGRGEAIPGRGDAIPGRGEAVLPTPEPGRGDFVLAICEAKLDLEKANYIHNMYKSILIIPCSISAEIYSQLLLNIVTGTTGAVCRTENNIICILLIISNLTNFFFKIDTTAYIYLVSWGSQI